MSEPVQLAKVAREHLASALRALQANGDVPPALEDLAEPIAEAMGVLHRVERSGGTELEGRDKALTNVRTVLDQLQAFDGTHPAVEAVMEEVAQSLGKVHALVRYVPPVAEPAPAQAVPHGTVRMDAQPAPQPQYVAPVQPQAPAWQPAPQPAAQHRAAPEPPKGSVGVIDVELGTHSPSNFYKGLGGNDVIEHGGIFVATYKVQKIGTNVALRVLLPGDYEFQANAVVQWIRAQGGSDEPGFGARFTHITPEGRQLVYRYTRNREPMFYDDL